MFTYTRLVTAVTIGAMTIAPSSAARTLPIPPLTRTTPGLSVEFVPPRPAKVMKMKLMMMPRPIPIAIMEKRRPMK